MDFEAFPKIPRLNRDIVITEKLDGTNAAVLIEEVDDYAGRLIDNGQPLEPNVVVEDKIAYLVTAQSRKRLITPEKGADNHGFAAWAYENAAQLVSRLGAGRHFGEWWGSGINRGYGLLNGEKRFSLFRPGIIPPGAGFETKPTPGSAIPVFVDTVPVLYEGPFRPNVTVDLDEPDPIEEALWGLRNIGSEAAPGFMHPEGIIVYHTAARQLFKVTLENDEAPKGSIHWGGDNL